MTHRSGPAPEAPAQRRVLAQPVAAALTLTSGSVSPWALLPAAAGRRPGQARGALHRHRSPRTYSQAYSGSATPPAFSTAAMGVTQSCSVR